MTTTTAAPTSTPRDKVEGVLESDPRGWQRTDLTRTVLQLQRQARAAEDVTLTLVVAFHKDGALTSAVVCAENDDISQTTNLDLDQLLRWLRN